MQGTMSATRLMVVLSSFVLLSTLVYGRNKTVNSEELEVIDGAARVEISELVLQDYNKLMADYQKLSSDCERNVKTAVSICEKCGKRPKLKELLNESVKAVVSKVIDGVERIGEKAGKFAKKLGKKVVLHSFKVLKGFRKAFRSAGKFVKKAIKGVRDAIRGVGRAVKRLFRRVRFRVRFRGVRRIFRLRRTRFRVRFRGVRRIFRRRRIRFRVRFRGVRRIFRLRRTRFRVRFRGVRRIFRRRRIRFRARFRGVRRMFRLRRTRRFIRFRFRRAWGKKKRSELTEREIRDITSIAVLSEKNEMSKRGVVAVTCKTCELDESALLNYVCRGMVTEQKRMEKHLKSLSEIGTSLESTKVIRSMFYDDDSLDNNESRKDTYTSVYVAASLGNYTLGFKPKTVYKVEDEAALEKMGVVIGKEAYRRFKLVSGWTTN